MDGAATLRELLGTKVTLIQNGLRVEGLVTEFAVRVGDGDDEEAQIHVDAADGVMHVLWLMPGDWGQAVRLFPLNHFLPDQPLLVEWQGQEAARQLLTTRRARPSSLAD
jgi:hypothetical protein